MKCKRAGYTADSQKTESPGLFTVSGGFFPLSLSGYKLLRVVSISFIFNSPEGPEIKAALIVSQQIDELWGWDCLREERQRTQSEPC